MRIAIIGSHGVGKSTLAEILSDKLNLPLITEQARKYTIPSTFCDHLVTVQKSIFYDQIKREQDCIDIYGSYISDRSILDNIVYWHANCNRPSTIYDTVKLMSLYAKNITNYTHIFYLPIEFEITGDGFRDTDKQYQQMIDLWIRLTLRDDNIKYYTLSGNIEERVNKATTILSSS